MALCGCCGIVEVASGSRDHDDHRPLHCERCRGGEHRAFATKRDTDHKAWWRTHHDATVAGLESVIGALRAALADPEARVREANERADSAYRSRDLLVRAISYIEEIHHSDGPELCSCGRKKSDCAEFKASFIARNFITRWEQRNKERMRSERDHELPRDHPVVTEVDRRMWRGAMGLDAEYAEALRFGRD